MNYEYGQGSDPTRNPWLESDHVRLASSCPKKTAGRKKFKETRHPVYRGVRQRNGDRWVCEVRDPNNTQTRIWLGTYPTPEMAARAHDVAALALRDPHSACLNFADSAWRLPRVSPSADAAEIRRVATQAAEAFRPAQGAAVEADHQRHDNIIETTRNEEGLGIGGGSGGNYNYNYVDEEAEYGMPGLMASMAEGMLLPPPYINNYNNNNNNNNNQWDSNDHSESDQYGEVSLWNY